VEVMAKLREMKNNFKWVSNVKHPISVWLDQTLRQRTGSQRAQRYEKRCQNVLQKSNT
jgi:hypothetical protein